MSSIDIVLPTFNRARVLDRAILSVLRQDFRNWELWIVDDGSSDGTAQIVKKHLRDERVHYLTQENQGVSAARNLGIRSSQNPWVAFLDSDDEWKPKKLSLQWEYLQRNPQLRMVHCNEKWLMRGVHFNQLKKHKKSGGRLFEACLPLCCISPSAALIHRGVLEKFGGFREDFPVCEDYDLWLKISAEYEVGFLEETLILKHGGHDDQLSKKFKAMDYYRVLAMSQHLNSPHLSAKERKALIDEIQKKSEVLMKGYEKRDNKKDLDFIRKISSRRPDLTS